MEHTDAPPLPDPSGMPDYGADGDYTPPLIGEDAGRAVRGALDQGYVDPVEHDD